MTLELTPEQRLDVTLGVQSFLEQTQDDAKRLSDFTPQSLRAATDSKVQRLQSLLDLLNTPGTTLILHRQ